MAGDITNEVLAERLGTLHDDLRDIKLDIAKLVSRELYNANREADQARNTALESRISALEARGRWWWAFVLIPVAAILANIWLSSKGVKP